MDQRRSVLDLAAGSDDSGLAVTFDGTPGTHLGEKSLRQKLAQSRRYKPDLRAEIFDEAPSKPGILYDSRNRKQAHRNRGRTTTLDQRLVRIGDELTYLGHRC